MGGDERFGCGGGDFNQIRKKGAQVTDFSDLGLFWPGISIPEAGALDSVASGVRQDLDRLERPSLSAFHFNMGRVSAFSGVGRSPWRVEVLWRWCGR